MSLYFIGEALGLLAAEPMRRHALSNEEQARKQFAYVTWQHWFNDFNWQSRLRAGTIKLKGGA